MISKSLHKKKINRRKKTQHSAFSQNSPPWTSKTAIYFFPYYSFIKCVGRDNQLSFWKWSNHIAICFCPLWLFPCGAHWPDIQMSAFASLPTAYSCYRLFIPHVQQATCACKLPVTQQQWSTKKPGLCVPVLSYLYRITLKAMFGIQYPDLSPVAHSDPNFGSTACLTYVFLVISVMSS